jgi:hypothetical protein
MTDMFAEKNTAAELSDAFVVPEPGVPVLALAGFGFGLLAVKRRL